MEVKVIDIITLAVSILGLTGIPALIYKFIKSRRGDKVLIEKTYDSSILKFPNPFTNIIKLTFRDRPVEQLVVYAFKIYNDGEKNIKNLEINLVMQFKKDELGGPDIQVIDNENKTETTILVNPTEHVQTIRIRRDYLNNKKQFNDFIYLQVISTFEIDFLVNGGGEGWKAEFKDSKKYYPSLRIGYLILFFISILLFELGIFLVIPVTTKLLFTFFAGIFLSSAIMVRYEADKQKKIELDNMKRVKPSKTLS